jgi:hypothetical protein
MNELAQGLLAEARGGLYRWLAPASPQELARDVDALGWRFFYLDGRQARDKANFLRAAATAMDFPAYFGHNWDAFEECLTDLAPAPGYVLLYDHVWWLACKQPESWQVARAILQGACAQWASRGTPLLVLLRQTHGCSGVTPLLRAPRPHQIALGARLR